MRSVLVVLLIGSMLCNACVSSEGALTSSEDALSASDIEGAAEEAERIGTAEQELGFLGAIIIALVGAGVGAAATFGSAYYQTHHQPPNPPCPASPPCPTCPSPYPER